MILNSTLFYILVIPFSIVLAILVAFILKKVIGQLGENAEDKANPFTAFIGLVVGIISIAVLYSSANDLVVLNEDETYDSYVFMGSMTFEVDGMKYELNPGGGDDSFLINKTGELLVYEDVEYGSSAFSFDIPGITGGTPALDALPADSMRVSTHLPDDYPWEEPPESITVSQGSSYDSREWLREATYKERKRYESGDIDADYEINLPDHGLNDLMESIENMQNLSDSYSDDSP